MITSNAMCGGELGKRELPRSILPSLSLTLSLIAPFASAQIESFSAVE